MANMPHCRFRNTVESLRSCYDALDCEEELSAEEERAKERLIKMCGNLAADYGDDGY